MTNSNLVPVFNGQIQNQSVQLANARDLHSFLGVGFDFSNWIKTRITEYGFIENKKGNYKIYVESATSMEMASVQNFLHPKFIKLTKKGTQNEI